MEINALIKECNLKTNHSWQLEASSKQNKNIRRK